jgi:amidase
VAAHGVALNPFEDSEFTALVAEFAAELPAYLSRRSGCHPRTWPELLAFNRADDIELSRFGDEIFELAAKAPSRKTQEYRRARADTDSQAGRSFDDVLSGCDFAVAPTNSPAWPVQYGQTEDLDVLTSSLCAVTGAPSVSLPAAVVNGLPVGVSVLGRHGQDEQVLGFAAALEALLPPPPEPPATPSAWRTPA